MVGKNTTVITTVVGLFGVSIIAFLLLSTPSDQKSIPVEDDIRIVADTKYNHYTNGETINIWGKIMNSKGMPLSEYNHAITLQILDDGDMLKEIAQVTPSSDGMFEHMISTDSSIWENGKYQLKAFYDQNLATAYFEIDGHRPNYTYEYDSDPLGNYKTWCNETGGIYSTGDRIGCQFETKEKAYNARDLLHQMEERTIEGSLAQKLCRAYGKICDQFTRITMEYDMITGELYKLKALEGRETPYTEFRIIEGDVVQYRPAVKPAVNWITFDG
ncbi:hypothetical protein NZNM25_01860 [Nitrosopumilus zosterae]|uniref:Uncharacterized protein n=1 Tax=Nitrosopumilus zosterae TaxID=718286 RepID=A0A2S2KPI1_9ARCH|nr:hypothetical protein [Nitrosopumilus zosterae]BDQ31183.1 hypothetical protein NZOSNM25_001294 [Nitrosopumilus zosterae]GBH33395.1 hypothetical protein NZNM25_01860 [Nitrosopumilus zosterae]